MALRRVGAIGDTLSEPGVERACCADMQGLNLHEAVRYEAEDPNRHGHGRSSPKDQGDDQCSDTHPSSATS